MAQAETKTQNPLIKCFENSEPKQAQIARAVRILLELLDKPENSTMMARWAQILTPFRGDQLGPAFNAAALACRGWPTPSLIVDYILEDEYTLDFTWLLENLAIHGASWQERPAVYGEMWRKDGAAMDDWQPGALVTAAVPPPLITTRLATTLTIVGGDPRGGLAFVGRHPLFWSPRYGGDDAMRIKAQIEKEFKAAWMQARLHELGGML